MPPSLNVVARLGLAAARFCVAAWIGAAVLFVLVGVREVTTPEFTSEVKDRLVTLRFPVYYAAGISLVGLAFFATVMASVSRPTWGLRIALLMLLLAAGLMVADYLWIYTPLSALVTPPGQPRTMAFITLHHWSMWINTVHLATCLIAAFGLFTTETNPRYGSDSPLAD